MTRKLYEEALADVKQLKESAEANAQRAILDAVTPRIKDLIENQLLREAYEDDEDDLEVLGDQFQAGRAGNPGSVAPGTPMGGVAVTTAAPVAVVDPLAPVAGAITPPDAEGKMTLDIDAICDPAGTAVAPPMMGGVQPGDEYELSLESVSSLSKVTKAIKPEDLGTKIVQLGESVERFVTAGPLVKRTETFQRKIALMITRVEDMYEHVQESIVNPAKKSSYQTQLESYFSELERLQGQTMSKNNKRLVNEEDVTLKLTGLPDDLELDGVGVDLITGEDGEEVSLDGEDGLGDGDDGEGGGLDDLSLDDEGEEEGLPMEGRRLSDDTIVEIDEGMLRREIARMRRSRLSEESVPSTAGGVDSKTFKSFGGGSDGGEALDADIPHKTDAIAALPLGEGEDDDLDEGEESMDEADDALDEMGAPSVPSTQSSPAVRTEALKKRGAFEQRLRERCQRKAQSIKSEVKRARAKKDLKTESVLKKQYSAVAKRFNESLERSKRITKTLAESARASRNGRTQNGVSGRPAESATEKNLRAKLAETNLYNAKLAYANKLLQNESLSAKQKSRIFEELDGVETVREAKLVYESISRTLAGTKSGTVNENSDRRVLGSSSRATTRASAPVLNEGVEAERWAKLAGISK